MNDTSSYKAVLEEEKKKLEGELESVGRRNPANPEAWEPVQEDTEPAADPTERADQLENFAQNSALLGDLEVRYTDVTSALSRIESGTYGICEVGNEEIEPERLSADPAARTCKAHMTS